MGTTYPYKKELGRVSKVSIYQPLKVTQTERDHCISWYKILVIHWTLFAWLTALRHQRINSETDKESLRYSQQRKRRVFSRIIWGWSSWEMNWSWNLEPNRLTDALTTALVGYWPCSQVGPRLTSSTRQVSDLLLRSNVVRYMCLNIYLIWNSTLAQENPSMSDSSTHNWNSPR